MNLLESIEPFLEGNGTPRGENVPRQRKPQPHTLAGKIFSLARRELGDIEDEVLPDYLERRGWRGMKPTEVRELEEAFKDHADSGELDIFTVIALKAGNEGLFTADVNKMLIRVLIAIVFQLCIPIMMLSFRLKSLSTEEAETDWRFRATGFLVYLYSLKGMHDAAYDACRDDLLNLAVRYPLPFAYVWPAIFGEILNCFVSIAMALTLYVNFLQQTHPADLVINALSLNFLGDIDTEFVDDELKSWADEHFDMLVETGPQLTRCPLISHCFIRFVGYSLWCTRILVTCCGGIVLAFCFLFSQESVILEGICSLNDSLDFCN
jgi:hypothetical protein